MNSRLSIKFVFQEYLYESLTKDC